MPEDKSETVEEKVEDTTDTEEQPEDKTQK